MGNECNAPRVIVSRMIVDGVDIGERLSISGARPSPTAKENLLGARVIPVKLPPVSQRGRRGAFSRFVEEQQAADAVTRAAAICLAKS